MSDVTCGARTPAQALPGLANQPLWVWWLAAFSIIALRQWLTGGTQLASYLGDMDDATRLVEVRDLIAGQSWFDMWTPRIGGEPGMLSHWSRLIDAPIALLIIAFKLVLPGETAELVTRTVWPLMVLAPLLYAMARAADTIAGRPAALITLALAAMCPMGLYQFDAGRIDHHNVMIAATLAATLILGSFAPNRRRWAAAGALCALALAVGYEALAPAAAITLAVVAWAFIDRRRGAEAAAYIDAFAITFALCFLLTIPPAHWLDVRCDAVSLNMVALALIGGPGARFALQGDQRWTLTQSLGITAAAGITGIAIYGALEPKCLAGPLGQLPKELGPIWLSTITESRSIALDLLKGNADQSLGLLVYYALGVAAAWRNWTATRSAQGLLLAILTSAFVGFACWQYKYTAYASFLVSVPLAVAISRLNETAGLSRGTVQACATIVLCQAMLVQGSKLLDAQWHAKPALAAGTLAPEACLTNNAIADLKSLTPGLIAARIDLGAHIVALTGHDVLSAPYHRIADAIMANHHIFAARTPQEAAKLLAAWKVDYVVTCRAADDPYVSTPQWQDTLRANLVAGAPPAFLTPEPLANAHSLFKVWRVDRAKLAAAATP